MKLKGLLGILSVVVVPLAACGPTSSGECASGHGDCDGNYDNGCEADLSSVNQCGTCGNVCSSANGVASCDQGECDIECDQGFANCDGDFSNGCEQSLNDPDHCGACYTTCTGTNIVGGQCVNAKCEVECAAGWGDCNSAIADGCESDLLTDQTCGACDSGCTTFCATGACETCEEDILFSSIDPYDAAKSIGICGGLISAEWKLPDGAGPMTASMNWAVGHGNLTSFGNNVVPRTGSQLLALSTGTAREPTGEGFLGTLDKEYTCGHPDGFPKESPACPGSITGQPHDGVALEVTLQVPEWAEGLAFDFDFYTHEWPSFICTQWNDFFVAILDPIPAGQTDGNITFDAQGNAVSVNNTLVSSCGCALGPPCLAGGKSFLCENGVTELAGTGFEANAATGWLTTKAPVPAGAVIKLRFGIYDSGDGIFDSTVLIDNFRWLAVPPDVETNPIE